MSYRVSIRQGTHRDGVAPMCDDCGGTSFKLMSGGLWCEKCGLEDNRTLCLDDSFERRVWDDKTSCHSNSLAKAPTITRTSSAFSTDHPSLLARNLRQSQCRQTPEERMHSTALGHAKSATRALQVECEDIAVDAVSFYTATRVQSTAHNQGIGGHVVPKQVIACTMVLARRITRGDIELVSDFTGISVKMVGEAIQDLTSSICDNPQLDTMFGALLHPSADTRFITLAKQAVAVLLVLLGDAEKESLCACTWGVCALTHDMLQHLQDSKMMGGNGLQELSRSILFLACRHHKVILPKTVPKTFVSKSLFKKHLIIWQDALETWPLGSDAFEAHVTKTRGMFEYGSSRVRGTQSSLKRHKHNPMSENSLTAPLATASFESTSQPGVSDLQSRRHHRAMTVAALHTDPRYLLHLGTAMETGVTHLCVFVAMHNTKVQDYLQGKCDVPSTNRTEQMIDRFKVLLEVCIDAILNQGVPQGLEPAHIVQAILATRGFFHEVLSARKFHTQKLPQPGCFMPVELINWSG